MNIDHLNDDCLMFLFKEFSCRELIHLRGVCTRWNGLIMVVGKSQKTLKLFGSFRDVDDYCRALLRYNLEGERYFKLDTLSTSNEIIGIGFSTKINANSNKRNMQTHPNASFNFLVDLFPNIKELIICDRYNEQPTNNDGPTGWKSLVKIDLNFLLAKWSKLSSLSLFMIPRKQILLALCTAQFNNLKRFEFFTTSTETRNYNRVYISENDSRFNINYFNILPSPVWAQLEYISIGCPASDMIFIFAHLGPKIKHLNLYNCSYEDLVILQQVKPGVVSKLANLTINLHGQTFEAIEFVCNNFSSLKFLCLMPCSFYMAFEKLVEQVSKLQQLTELRVCYLADYQNSKNESRLTQTVRKEVLKKCQLKSIKTLQIKNSGLVRSGTFEPAHWIPKIFPELEHLVIGEHCAKNTFAKIKSIHKAYCRYIDRYQDGKVSTDLYCIPLRDDLTPFIGTYDRLYKNFKKEQKIVKTERHADYHHQLFIRAVHQYDSDDMSSEEEEELDSDDEFANDQYPYDEEEVMVDDEEEQEDAPIEYFEHVDEDGVINIF